MGGIWNERRDMYTVQCVHIVQAGSGRRYLLFCDVPKKYFTAIVISRLV